MGEYAMYRGSQIKIGSCEDMFYLRFDQRLMVDPLDGSVNPRNNDDCLSIRFRFPFPDEDDTEPGAFDDFNRSVPVPGMKTPQGMTHYPIQFKATGYVLSLPCPESGECPVEVRRNGLFGAVRLAQQKLLADGRLVPVIECGGCGSRWRVDDEDEIRQLATLFREEGDRHNQDRWFYLVAERILRGAKISAEAVAMT